MVGQPLLFPVIAWYDIIVMNHDEKVQWLLFPVIAWYDIMSKSSALNPHKLLFPVIAWYDIIGNEKSPCLYMFTGIFHLKNLGKLHSISLIILFFQKIFIKSVDSSKS